MNFFSNLKEHEGMKPGLSRIRRFLKEVGDPQNKLKVVHIAGTNGKGSTATFIASILNKAGYKTALYTSPHLINITERIKINGKNITNERFEDLSNKYISEAVGCSLSYFEYLTALAFVYFDLQKVDIAVIETGLGGRFDATNVIKNPLICIITSIEREHQEILGNTIEKIAFEKAGIIKKGCYVVCGKLPKKAELVVSAKSVPCIYGKDFKSKSTSDTNIFGQTFNYIGKNLKLKNVHIKLLGVHQVINASVAICVTQLLSKMGFGLNEKAIRTGLSKAVWRGRFEIKDISVNNKDFKLIVDGAHNVQGLKCFLDTFKRLGFANEKKVFIFAVMKEKQYKQMVKLIVAFADKIILPYLKNSRAVSPVKLKQEFSKYIPKKRIFIKSSVEKIFSSWSDCKIGISVGSLYLSGEVLALTENIVSGNNVQTH